MLPSGGLHEMMDEEEAHHLEAGPGLGIPGKTQDEDAIDVATDHTRVGKAHDWLQEAWPRLA